MQFMLWAKRYTKLSPEDFEKIFTDEKAHLGCLHPAADTRYRDKKPVLAEYILKDPTRPGVGGICIETGIFTKDENSIIKYDGYILYNGLLDNAGKPYYHCTEDNLIGWIFLDELKDILDGLNVLEIYTDKSGKNRKEN